MHKYSVGGCQGQEKDGAERLMQQTKGTDFKRGHCGDSKFLVDIADTYCAEITESSHSQESEICVFNNGYGNCSVTSRTGEHSWEYPWPPGRFSHKTPTAISS